MKRYYKMTILLSLVGVLLLAQFAHAKPRPIPGDAFVVTSDTTIAYQVRKAPRAVETSLQPLAEVLSGEIELVTGVKLAIKPYTAPSSVRKGDIVLRFGKIQGDFAEYETEEDHSFTMTASAKGAVISSAYYKGVALGTVELIQALQEVDGQFVVPASKVEDKPATAFRSVMIDVARSQHSIHTLKDTIRLARQCKLRYVHLHLTDNEAFTFPFEPIISKLGERDYHFTREELLDLVAYADARGITLIPEVDAPGHTRKLIQSGYLHGAKGDADVADPKHFDKLAAIIDDTLSVFASSPYFHIGGDESAAGSKLVPFLKMVNDHLRGKPEGQKRRLIVWEGFHGAPTEQLPPKGEDRVIVMVWDHGYNLPWNLLEAGYEVVNCSWKPTYLVGPGTPFRGWNTGGRKAKFSVLHKWDKNQFDSHDLRSPIYTGNGPKDRNKDDTMWDARYIGKQDQVIGGQVCFWEQYEQVVMRRLPLRLAIFSSKLWNPSTVENDFDEFMKEMAAEHERMMTIVQPVEVVVSDRVSDEDDPIVDMYHHVDGDEIRVVLRNRTGIKGDIRYEVAGVSGSPTGQFSFRYPDLPSVSSPKYGGPISTGEPTSVRAALFRDGKRIEGTTWDKFCNWENVVRYTEYNIGKYPPEQGVDVDLAKLPPEQIQRVFELPMIRQPLQDIELKAHMIEGVFTAPDSGGFRFFTHKLSFRLDLNQNGEWDDGDFVWKDPLHSNDRMESNPVELKKGEKYRYRLDRIIPPFQGGMIMFVSGPGIKVMHLGKYADLSSYSTMPPE